MRPWAERSDDGDGGPDSEDLDSGLLGPLAADASVRCPNGSLGPCCPNLDLAKCLTEKLKPVRDGPFLPVPPCVPRPPKYDHCITPMPTRSPNAPRTPTARP